MSGNNIYEKGACYQMTDMTLLQCCHSCTFFSSGDSLYMHARDLSLAAALLGRERQV